MKSKRTIRSILPGIVLVALIFTVSYLKAETVEGSGSKKVYSINETAEVEGVKYKITNVEQSQGIGDTPIASDTRTLIIQMSIENSSKALNYDSYDWELKKEINTKDDTLVIKNIAELTTGTLSPGETKSVDLIYILPKEKSDFYLCYNTKDEANKIVFKITGLK